MGHSKLLDLVAVKKRDFCGQLECLKLVIISIPREMADAIKRSDAEAQRIVKSFADTMEAKKSSGLD